MNSIDDATKRYTDDELYANEIMCRWLAHVFDEPIPVPGDNYVRNLAEAIPALFDLSNTASEGIALLDAFLEEVEQTNDPAALQQKLAVDRTALFRGVSEQGVKPPYEDFYRAAGEGGMTALVKLMREAGIGPAESNRERVDYLGNELALSAYLCRRALDQGQSADADTTHRLLEELLEDHLRLWAPRYCEVALPFAQTSFFQGFLLIVKEYFSDK